MHIFHKWEKWEQYSLTGTAYPGMIAPKAIQGKQIAFSELRQKRKCEVCGKMQDELIREY